MTVTRSNVITYGGFSVGSGTSYPLHGMHFVERDYTGLTLRAQVFVQHDTTSSFITLCTALEDAYRVRNGDLTVTIGGASYLALTQAGNTGFLATPSITKRGDDRDSNNSRIYDISISLVLPADETGKSGRRTASVSVTEDGAEILDLVIVAEYTALGGNDALAQAQSAFPTYCTAQQTALSGTWDELGGRTYTYDSDDKLCTARAAYRQIIANQSTAGLNHTTLQGVELVVESTTLDPQSDDGSNAESLILITVGFSCRVRSSVSTDLRSVWEGTVRPHMVAQASALTGVGSVTAVSVRPQLDTQNNTIRASMAFVAPGAGSILSSVTNSSYSEALPVQYVPVLDGGAYSADEHFTPGIRVASVSTTIAELAALGSRTDAFKVQDSLTRLLEADGYKLLSIEEPQDRVQEFPGLASTTPLRIRFRTRTKNYRYVEEPGGGGLGSTRTRSRR